MFREAFEEIGLAAGKAAALPDHRDCPRESTIVDKRSPGGEVSLVIREGRIEGLTLDPMWLEDEFADTIATVIQRTINEAYQEWAERELEGIKTATPDLKELYGALGAARASVCEADGPSTVDAAVSLMLTLFSGVMHDGFIAPLRDGLTSEADALVDTSKDFQAAEDDNSLIAGAAERWY